MNHGRVNNNNTLEQQGITGLGAVYYNLQEPALMELAVSAGEGQLGQGGSLLVSTGKFTGRRFCQVVSLTVVYAHGRQQLTACLVLDGLGDGHHAEHITNPFDGIDHRLVDRVMKDVPHKLAIDLEVVDR